jgi:hypothetical protein
MATLRIRELLTAVMLVAVFVWVDRPWHTVTAAEMNEWCYEACDSEADCDLECENDGGGPTTCGEYDGGASNGWCDGDTCEDVCGPYSDPSWACYANGQPTDCYGYGDYVTCGDGFCSTITELESCGTCEDDCDVCPEIECGNSSCEFGESYRTCPQDCPDGDGETNWCGDGQCDSNEDLSCVDCQDPNEFCDYLTDHYCPANYQCVANFCSHDDVTARQSCVSTCPVGYTCQFGFNVMINDYGAYCFLDRQ